MSHRYVPVGWNRAKLVYDAVLLAGIAGYLLAYTQLAPLLLAGGTPLDPPTVAMRARGSCAFLLLSLALAIGPLARLEPRCLPMLYNRRHLGVATFGMAAWHALAVLDWYFAFSPTPGLVALLISEPGLSAWPGLPFIPFGILALLILFALAATSHDFWLAFLGPPRWKALHMLIYAAYALVVAHIAFGQLQAAGNPALASVVIGSAALLVGLHLAAGRRGAAGAPAEAAPTPWLPAGRADAIPEGRAIIINPPGAEAVAIFRHAGRLSAVSNLCAHQNGPLGEGQIIGGCITCPWHGFQYWPEDGCAPPPYTEKLATYRLALDGPLLLLDPRPNPPGTPVPPLPVPGAPSAADPAVPGLEASA